MLSDGDWTRLIDGLITATEAGRLDWQGEGVRQGGIAGVYAASGASLSRLIAAGRTRLTATTTKSIYEVSASHGGLAPFGLKVWERTGFNQKEIGSVDSSVSAGAMRSGVNDALRALWNAAAATVEPGDVIVDRLLEDLEG